MLLSWLPGGKMVSAQEFACADLEGGPSRKSGGGGSLSVNITTGKWSDFATGEKGTDLISLYAAIFGKDMKTSFNDLRSMNKISFNTRIMVPPNSINTLPHHPVLFPPPSDCEPPDFEATQWGKPQYIWTYRNAEGGVLFHVARYKGKGGGKQFIPFSWNGKAWVRKHWPAPRPLYKLSELRRHTPVLIVEGEKAADAAAEIVKGSNYDVVTWSSGSKAMDKVDWQPIYGRKILLWPDVDVRIASSEAECKRYHVDMNDPLPNWAQAGVSAMIKIAEKLTEHCPEIKLINIPFDDMQVKEVPGWDAADALRQGWGFDDFVAWAKPLAVEIYMGQHPDQPHKKIPKHFPSVTAQKLPAVHNPRYMKQIPAPEPDDLGPIEPEVIPKSTGKPEQVDDDIPRSTIAKWEDCGVDFTDRGPVINIDNVTRVFTNWKPLQGLVWYDEFHRKIFTNGYNGTRKTREWIDVDDLNIATMLQRELAFKRLKDDTVHKAVVVHAHKNTRNEPKDWMETLKWDQGPRVETFFIDYFGTADTAYHRAVSKNWWVSMIARIYSPGCKVDNMVIIEGEQGKFKSTALSVIGGEWFTEATESVMTKDFYMSLQGKVLIEIAELDAFSRGETTTIKRVVSCAKDRFRPPYGRLSQDFPRQCIFVGTTNEEEYLRDHTGGRRSWPIKIKNIDIESLKRDREQLFAEAVYLYKSGATWHDVPLEEAKAQQEFRRNSDEWEDVVAHFLAGRSETTTHEVAKEGLQIDIGRLDNFTQRRIGRVLQILGWKKAVRKRYNRNMKIWTLPGGSGEKLPKDGDWLF
jgi:predicted P-loop ATPase